MSAGARTAKPGKPDVSARDCGNGTIPAAVSAPTDDRNRNDPQPSPPTRMPKRSPYLDPKVLQRIGRLELRARNVVEGYLSGMHRSPYHGFSVEFAEHREYVPGDDLRHVDWKVWSKTDRFYVKQYEEETNLTTHFCVDVSESMSYGAAGVSGRANDRGMGKLDYAFTAAASLAHLLIGQQDSVGLSLIDNSLKKFIPAAAHPTTITDITRAMEAAKPEARTDPEPLLGALAEKLRRRGVVVLLSDLLAPADSFLRGLKRLRHRRHEVIVFHILHPDERVFPFERLTLFEGMEEQPDLLAEPRALREGYLQALAEHEREMRTGCAKAGIDFIPLSTDQHLDAVLASFLARRSGK